MERPRAGCPLSAAPQRFGGWAPTHNLTPQTDFSHALNLPPQPRPPPFRPLPTPPAPIQQHTFHASALAPYRVGTGRRRPCDEQLCADRSVHEPDAGRGGRESTRSRDRCSWSRSPRQQDVKGRELYRYSIPLAQSHGDWLEQYAPPSETARLPSHPQGTRLFSRDAQFEREQKAGLWSQIPTSCYTALHSSTVNTPGSLSLRDFRCFSSSFVLAGRVIRTWSCTFHQENFGCLHNPMCSCLPKFWFALAW